MKAIVLGSSGFIGSALMAELERHGIETRGLGSRDLDLTALESVDGLRRLLTPDTLLFVACRAQQKGTRESMFSRDLSILTNLARCLEGRRLARCVNLSSLSVYGNAASDLAITEETPTAPDSLYGISKFAGEVLLKEATAEAGTPFLNLRPPMVYGPGDTSTAYGPARFIRSLLEHGEIRIFGDGTELRPYVFIRDLARISVELALGGREGTFLVDSGENHSFAELIEQLRSLAGPDLRVRRVERDRPKTDQKLDPSKLLGALPGARFTAFARGLAEAYDQARGGVPASRG